MTQRRLTDEQIAAALRAHVPAEAPAWLRSGLREALEVTPQPRRRASVVRWAPSADLVDSKTGLLLVAALLLATLLAGLAAAGAMRLFERKATPQLDLAKPSNVAALVGSTYSRMPQMPPVAITASEYGAATERIYVDGSGAVRFEHYASAAAASPDTYRILSGTALGALVNAASGPAWVEQRDAIAEDPRVFLVAELEGSGVQPGCAVTGTTSGVTLPVGWSYVGADVVAGRPAYHVTCGGGDLWIDASTSLILRSQGPGGPSDAIEVTGLALGDQPEDLFRITPPPGVPSMSSDAYACQLAGATCSTPAPTPADTLPPGYALGPVGSLPPGRVGNGWIAYSTDGPAPGATDNTTGSDLYLVRPGGNPVLVAGRENGTARNGCPRFSPDGTRLAYVASSSTGIAIIVRGVGPLGVTSEAARIAVPAGGAPACAEWSADGRRLAYLDGATEVVRGLDGSTLAPAPGDPSPADLADPFDGSALRMSPSGEWAARVRGDATGSQLVVSRPDGARAHVIELAYSPYAIAAWSPDGARLLLMQDVSGTDFTMHEVDIGTGAQSVVVSTVRTNGARSWPGWGEVSWQPVLP